jgi:predicted metal-dependent phosphotriesterase family hydrolase
MPTIKTNQTNPPGAPFVSTILGPVAPESLGMTSMHEHLICDVSYALGLVGEPIQSLGALARIDECLAPAIDTGLRTFVDVSTQQFGASPLMMLAVAQRTGIHIVSAIGCFPLDEMPAPGWAYPPATVDDITERFVGWAEHGVQESGIRPGILKLGTGVTAITKLEENVFRAAVATQRQTGLAITTHTHETRLAEEQTTLLEEAGADLDRVVIGHMGWGTGAGDLNRHVALAERGVTLGFDLIGLPGRTLEEYAEMTVDLVEAGHAERIVLATDSVAVSRGLFEIWGDGFLQGDFAILTRDFLPLLRERGLDEATIEQIMVENPRRVLTIDPARYPTTRLAAPPTAPRAVVPIPCVPRGAR